MVNAVGIAIKKSTGQRDGFLSAANEVGKRISLHRIRRTVKMDLIRDEIVYLISKSVPNIFSDRISSRSRQLGQAIFLDIVIIVFYRGLISTVYGRSSIPVLKIFYHIGIHPAKFWMFYPFTFSSFRRISRGP